MAHGAIHPNITFMLWVIRAIVSFNFHPSKIRLSQLQSFALLKTKNMNTLSCLQGA